jgi:hypothetical protein
VEIVVWGGSKQQQEMRRQNIVSNRHYNMRKRWLLCVFGMKLGRWAGAARVTTGKAEFR